ncbi:MAG TPA: amidohydrolase family protein [Casimicrobiaceae bacterium]|nr:amidohydrolase family protein [Casimicrobiaceae bacterium]
MKIIDFRVRPPMQGITNQIFYTNPQRRDGFNRKLGFTPAPSAQQGSMSLLFEEMDAVGVTLGVVVGRVSQTLGTTSNDDVATVVKEHPNRFVGIAGIDPLDRKAAVKEIDRAIDQLGLRGVNLEPGTYRIPLYADDRRLYPIYAHCEDRDIPVILMTGGNPGPDLSYTDPVTVDRVAADFPGLKIILSHGNWPWVHQILHVAFRRPNVYVSPDMYLFDLPGSEDYIKAADTYLADQFVYASAYPFTPLKDYAERFLHLPIRPESMRKVLYDNAARLLKLPA